MFIKEEKYIWEIIEPFINSINISIGESNRYDCPVCEGVNTLSITNFGDCIKFNCFKSSCDTSGAIKNGISQQSFKQTISIQKEDKKLDSRYWRASSFPLNLYEYLISNNCVPAFEVKRVDIRYDYQKNRAVFLIKNNKNQIIDATGRSLNPNILPKWYRYGNSKSAFICGKFPHAVVVEDCASATAISHLTTGVALLGTNLTDEITNKLTSFKKVSIALDKDATLKSISLINELRWNVDNLDIILLEKDLKHEKFDNLQGVLKLNDRETDTQVISE